MKSPAPQKAAAKRLPPEQRERQIVAKAVEHFARHGFAGSTRELAREIGVTQSLLYRYFPSKDALVDRVYTEVFAWSPSWESTIADRSVPLRDRLHRFYGEYAKVVLQEAWIRIFIFAGLTHEGINHRYLRRLRGRVFLPLLAEIRAEFGIAEPQDAAELETEVELLWSLHAGIVYLGVRKWIYGLRIPKSPALLVRRMVDAFLDGTPAVLQSLRAKRGGG